MLKRKATWTAIGMAAVAVLLAVSMATAQGPGQPGQGGPGGEPGQMMRPMGGGGSAIAATATAVFVVLGPTVYKLDPETLAVVAKGELPRPEPPAGVAGQGNQQRGRVQ